MFDFENHGFEKLNRRVWLNSPTMHGPELEYVKEAYATNWMSTVGANILELEKEMCEKVGCKYAVALSTGTAAIHSAVKLAGIRPNQKVFVSDLTFIATANPVVYEGGIPVFIDAEYDTWNMDPAALERAFEFYPEVRTVVVAHLYGTPGKLDEIREICGRYGAKIIEDAAESLGAVYKGKQTGTYGSFHAVSFNGNKIITGSTGGMFLTDRPEDAARVRKWSEQSKEKAAWYQHEEIGYNYRMSNVIAGIVRGQLPYLEQHIAQKRIIYERYKEGLKGLPVAMNPIDFEHSRPNYWMSCLLIDPDVMCCQISGERDVSYIPEHGKSCPAEILKAIDSVNAEGRRIWKPMHMQPVFGRNSFVTGNGRTETGVSTDIFERGLCLPSDNKMTEEEQDRIIKVIRKCFE